MNIDINPIVEKIRKLLALATSSNEHEATLAAQRANEILVKHNLTMQQLESTPLSEYEERNVDQRTFRKAEEKFVDHLLVKHFFVKIYTFRQRGPNYGKNNSRSTWYTTNTVLVGTKTNVEIASYIRMFLVSKFYSLWIEYKRTNNIESKKQQAYYNGLAKGLGDKLTLVKDKVQAQEGLVLVEDSTLKKMMDRMNCKSSTSKFSGCAETTKAGFEDGKKIEIRRGITTKSDSNGKLIGSGK